MRKILAAIAISTALATPAQAQYFWGSGPGWGQGGGWNACSNCGMRAFGPGGGYYMGLAGGTNGFGRGLLGWGGIPSASGYGMGWGGNALVGQTLGQFMGGGMGPLGMLGGLFGGGMPGNYYPGAIYQQPGIPPGNTAYYATRYGGGGSYPHPQYRNPQVYNRSGPGPGYPFAQSQQYGGGAGYRRAIASGYQPPVQYLPAMPRRPTCQIVSNGVAYTKVCY